MSREQVLVIYREPGRVQAYRDAVEAGGVTAVPLSPMDLRPSLRDFQGLVLTGGTDVDPRLYGEEKNPETEPPDPQRDALEAELLREALDMDLPVLAICRGLQLLNVVHGGTLTQHLDPPDRHRRYDGDRSLPVHDVAIEPGTLLASIAGTRVWHVNSRHHQAVKTAGSQLRVSAVDVEDGIIEGLERPDKRFVLAVQWHPEDQVRDGGQRNIFRRFAAAVKERNDILSRNQC